MPVSELVPVWMHRVYFVTWESTGVCKNTISVFYQEILKNVWFRKLLTPTWVALDFQVVQTPSIREL
jgi:hypothetical protein